MDRINNKHLDREQFRELLNILECYEPDHPITEWIRRGFCVNDGDSTIHVCSLAGIRILQWHLDEFDEEDDEFYEQWYGNAEDSEAEWDFD